MPSEWLKVVTHDDHVWETQPQARDMLALIMNWYNLRAAMLLEESDLFEPLFDQVQRGKRVVYDSWSWCAGYMTGANLRFEGCSRCGMIQIREASGSS